MTEKRSWRDRSLPSILFGDTIVPGYVPLYYRLYLLGRKLLKSVKNRITPSSNFTGAPSDEGREDVKVVELSGSDSPLINKTSMDLDNDMGRPEVIEAARSIHALEGELEDKKLKFTTPAGTFKLKDYTPLNERTKLWENAWVLAHSKVDPGHAVLDIGGASTIFSFLLASMGCEVHVIDNDWGNHGIIYNARYVSSKMGWNMKAYNRDIVKRLPFEDNYFDRVFSVCVMEHLPSDVRKIVMSEVYRVLKPGGIVGMTMDYDIHRKTPGLDRGIRYSLKEKLEKDIIEPSGLKVYGNSRLVDDCPREFFLGSLFLVKR